MKKGKKSDNDEEEQAGTSEDKVGGNQEKKAVTFTLKSEESQESFVSALSKNSDDEGGNEALPVVLRVSQSKLTFNPRVYAKPRVANIKNYVGSKEFILDEVSSQMVQTDSSHQHLSSDDVNMRLIHAIYLRRVKDARKAIENGADVNYLFAFESPLLISTEIGDTVMVSYLLTVPNINVNQKNEFGQAALSLAVRNSFDQIVALLLNFGADVNTQDHLGRTPLHNALFLKKRKTVIRLLAFNANVELEDYFGERPIYTSAVRKPDMFLLRTLLTEGAKVNYISCSKVPLISRVIMNGTRFSIIETLIEFGASVNQPDLASRTPLHYAALSNHLPATKVLIENGAEIQLKTLNHFSALDEAKAHYSRDVIDYLDSLQPRSSELSLATMKKNKYNED